MRPPIAVSAIFLSIAACQHAADLEGPAVLTDSSAETLDALEGEVLSALNKRGWSLDASGLAESSTMMVRPPKPDPNNTLNLDAPFQLELRHRAGECFVAHPDTDEEIFLSSITCEPIN